MSRPTSDLSQSSTSTTVDSCNRSYATTDIPVQLSKENQGLVDWDCPHCNSRVSTKEHIGAYRNITKQSQLVSHMNKYHNDGNTTAPVKANLARIGVAWCATARTWQSAEQWHETHQQRRDSDNTIDRYDSDTTPSAFFIATHGCSSHSSIKGTRRAGTAGGMWQQLNDQTLRPILQWSEQMEGLTDIEARQQAYITGLDIALRYGIKNITMFHDPSRFPSLLDTMNDPDHVAAHYLGSYFLDSRAKRIKHLTQLNDITNPESFPELPRIKANVELLAQSTMDDPENKLGIGLHMISPDWMTLLPPLSERLDLDDIHGTESDSLIDEMQEEINELDDDLDSLQHASESSEDTSDNTFSTNGVALPDCNSINIDQDELTSIHQACDEWAEAIANGGQTMRTIPPECVDDYVKHAKRFLQQYFDQSISWKDRSQAFCEYLALPKQVLQKHRGGRSQIHQSTRTRNVRQRMRELDHWLTEHTSIESSSIQTRSKAKAASDEDRSRAAAITRASRLIDGLHVGRAARALNHTSGLGDLTNDSVVQEMREKHPDHEISAEAIEAMNSATYSDINVDELTIKRTVNRMNNGASPGYDGQTAAIMKATLKDKECRALHTKLVNEIVNGRMIAPLASLIQRGQLIAISKTAQAIDDDGNVISATHRPIMIGTFLYRLAAKIANSIVQPVAAKHLSPLQLGIATPGAIEAAVHNLREHLRNNPDDAEIDLDVNNAFNAVSRSKMIIEVMTKPWLEPLRGFVRMAYSRATHILMPDKSGRFSIIYDMLSKQGVRQGDPLGSLLFAITIHPILKEFTSEHPSIKLVSYHDDTKLVGKPKDLVPALDAIIVKLATIELRVQPTKSKLIDFHFAQRNNSFTTFVADRGLKVEDKCGNVLGCPVGQNDEHEKQFMVNKLNTIKQSIDILHDPRLSIHHTALILRISTIHKLDHWLRNVDPSVMHDIAASFDQTIYDIFRRKLGLDQQIAENEHQNQNSNIAMRDLIGAPISLGGDGLTRTLTTVETCFIGGVASAAAVPTTISYYNLHRIRTTNRD
jgi:hypothetical protein